MSPDQIRAILASLAALSTKATPAPWRQDRSEILGTDGEPLACCENNEGVQRHRDAALIVALRNAVPDLLAALPPLLAVYEAACEWDLEKFPAGGWMDVDPKRLHKATTCLVAAVRSARLPGPGAGEPDEAIEKRARDLEAHPLSEQPRRTLAKRRDAPPPEPAACRHPWHADEGRRLNGACPRCNAPTPAAVAPCKCGHAWCPRCAAAYKPEAVRFPLRRDAAYAPAEQGPGASGEGSGER